MTIRYGDRTLDGLLFDLDDVLVPFHTPAMWQWAWKPQGPVLGERRVRAAVRRSLKAWDHRRWHGLTGKAAPADLTALHQHLADTLSAIAGHPLPAEETEAVVRRVLRPAGEVERYAEVPPTLERLRAVELRIGIVTPLPTESARWLLHRTGLDEGLLVASGAADAPSVPDPKAFRSAVERLGSEVERFGFVGDLFWSDVRAAARAGLAAVLLDRHELWPKVQGGRTVDLGRLEATFAAGEAGPDTAGAPDP